MDRRLRIAALLVLVGVAGVRCGGDSDPPSASTIVLVTVDTLRRDYVGAYGTATRPSPARTKRMDELARSGARFSDARTPIPLTLPAHVTMMTGLPPAAHGVRSYSASRVPPRAA